MTSGAERQSTLRRRRLLSLVGGVGASAVAGCFGGENEAQSDGTGGDSGEVQTESRDQDQTNGQSRDDEDPDSNGEVDADAHSDCPEWSTLERVDLLAYGVSDFPVVPSYPEGWAKNTAFVDPDEAILSVADPDREAGNAYDYVSVQVRLIDAEGAVPSREDWPTRDWMQAQDEADPVLFEGEERPVGYHEAAFEALWEFTAEGPNDTHMLVDVIVRFQSEDCLSSMRDLGREVLDTLELNADSSI